MFTKYHNAAQFLEGLNNLTQKQYLVYQRDARQVFRRYLAFLEYIGHPERGFRAVHIAGTSGKGSTTHLIHAMLAADGRRVGSFYSPYVTTPLDSILINDRYLAPNVFADLVWELADALQGFIRKERWDAPSYFEIKTTLAFLAFHRARVDWVVLETGLGGELDATNVLEKKEAAVITNIGWDHANVIGPRLKDIAQAKGGIITKGTKRVLTTEQRPAFVRMFRNRAQRTGATFLHVPEDATPNGALADAVAASLHIPEKARLKARAAKLPGRFEVMQQQPQVILDTAHNTEKVRFLAARLAEQGITGYTLFFACAASKDGTEMLRLLAKSSLSIVLTRYSTPFRKCHDIGVLYRSLPAAQRRKTRIRVDPVQAFTEARAATPKSRTILITGSTFLVGDIRQVYIPEAQILRYRTSFPPNAKRR